MNRKNLTAAVLAGLAGAAGLAATAQAVNINPDGLGQVLIYPYYTSNDGNQTILSVVNTTDQAKAVKVRFLEGYNSREVLDFNLYLSPWDVWAAAIFQDDGTPYLAVADDSCTVPYLYDADFDDVQDDPQPFLRLAYSGDFSDGGPDSIQRAGEGYFTMMEMGTLVGDAAEDATHQLTPEVEDDEVVIRPETWEPADCEALVERWTRYEPPINDPDDHRGIWFEEADAQPNCDPYNADPDLAELEGCIVTIDTVRSSGGLFGGAAVVNSNNGTMYSYDAQAVQGWDKTANGVHYLPGSIYPTFNSGDQTNAFVFFGTPQDRAVELFYSRPVDAMSAVFMHDTIMNEYTFDADLAASTEWVITFPTKRFYVDPLALEAVPSSYWVPTEGDPLCANWEPGDPYPTTKGEFGDPIDGPGPWPNIAYGWDWSECVYVEVVTTVEPTDAVQPFTELFDGEACELAGLQVWDRSERTYSREFGGERPPVVSPSLPSGCDPDFQVCEEVEFELCYEVNVVRWGYGDDEFGSIFGTPTVGADEEGEGGSSLLIEVDTQLADESSGWARISFSADEDHVDAAGLVGLPVTGFAAYEFENNYVSDGDTTVKAFYGGLFGHKGSTRRIVTQIEPQ